MAVRVRSLLLALVTSVLCAAGAYAQVNYPDMMYFRFNETSYVGNGNQWENIAFPRAGGQWMYQGSGNTSYNMQPLSDGGALGSRCAYMPNWTTSIGQYGDPSYSWNITNSDSWTVEWRAYQWNWSYYCESWLFAMGNSRYNFSVYNTCNAVYMYLWGSNYYWGSLPQSPSNSVWGHYAVTYNASTRALTFYYNGQQTNQYANVNSSASSYTGTNFTFWNHVSTTSSSSTYWDRLGQSTRVDEFRMWRRARTQAQIQAAMNTELTLPNALGMSNEALVNSVDRQPAGANNVDVLRINAASFQANRDIASLTFTKTGSLADNLITPTLWVDTNLDGIADTNITPSATTITNGTFSFAGSPLRSISNGASVGFIVRYNISGSAPAGATYGASLASESNISVSPSGIEATFPMAGPTFTVLENYSNLPFFTNLDGAPLNSRFQTAGGNYPNASSTSAGVSMSSVGSAEGTIALGSGPFYNNTTPFSAPHAVDFRHNNGSSHAAMDFFFNLSGYNFSNQFVELDFRWMNNPYQGWNENWRGVFISVDGGQSWLRQLFRFNSNTTSYQWHVGSVNIRQALANAGQSSYSANTVIRFQSVGASSAYGVSIDDVRMRVVPSGVDFGTGLWSPTMHAERAGTPETRVGAFRTTAKVAGQTITSLTLTRTGTLSDSQISNVRLWRDNNSNGFWDRNDTLLGTATFANGRATFSGSPLVNLGSADSFFDMFVTMTPSSSAPAGGTYGYRIAETSDVTLGGSTAVLGDLPASGLKSIVTRQSTFPWAEDFESPGQISGNISARYGRGGTLQENYICYQTGGTASQVYLNADYTQNTNSYTNLVHYKSQTDPYNGIGAPVGTGFLAMRAESNSSQSAASVDFHFDLSAYNVATDVLNFSFRMNNYSATGSTPWTYYNRFFVSIDGGANWAGNMWSYSSSFNGSWGQQTFNLQSVFNGMGVPYSGNVVIRCQRLFTSSWQMHYLDDVSLTVGGSSGGTGTTFASIDRMYADPSRGPITVPDDMPVAPGTQRALVGVFTAFPSGTSPTITSIVLTKYGTLPDNEVAAVRIHDDSNQNNFFDQDDRNSYQRWDARSIVNGTVTFNTTNQFGQLGLSNGQQRRIWVTVDLTPNATRGGTLGFRVQSVNDIVVNTGSKFGTFPVELGNITIGGRISNLPWADDFDGTTMLSGTQHRNQRELRPLANTAGAISSYQWYDQYGHFARNGSGNFNSTTVTPRSGNRMLSTFWNYTTCFSVVEWHVDLSSYNIATDQVVFGYSSFNVYMDSSSISNVFVSVDGGQTWACSAQYLFASSNQLSSSWTQNVIDLQAALSARSEVYSSDVVIRVQAYMPSSNESFHIDDVFIENRINSLSVSALAGGAGLPVAAGSVNVPVLSFNARAVNVGQQVTSVTVEKTGNIDDADVENVRLWQDANGNGALDSSDTLLGTTTLSSGSATFSSLTANFPTPGQNVGMFVTFSLEATAQTGATFGARLEDQFAITLQSSNPVVAAAFPVGGGTLSVATNGTLPFSSSFDGSIPSNITGATAPGNYPVANSAGGTVGTGLTYKAGRIRNAAGALGGVSPRTGNGMMALDFPGVAIRGAAAMDFRFDLGAYDVSVDQVFFDAWLRDSTIGQENSAFDGIYLSVDGGTNWIKAWHPNWGAIAEWTRVNFDISALLSAASLDFSSQTVIRIQASDDLEIPFDGVYLDDVFIGLGQRLQVSRNSTVVPNGDYIDIGNVTEQSATQLTLTLTNVGHQPLQITGATQLSGAANIESGATVSSPASNPIQPGTGNATTVVVNFTVTAAGGFGFTLDFQASGDASLNGSGGVYSIDIVGTGTTPNDVPVASLPTGSAFSGSAASGFNLAVNPGTALSNAQITLTDPDSDDIEIISVTASPSGITGVTAPAAASPAGGPITLSFTGTPNGSNTVGLYTYTVTYSDGVNLSEQFQVRIVVNDVAPAATAVSGVTGTGAQVSPFAVQASMGATAGIAIASVSDANTYQTMSISSVTPGSNPTANRFTFTLSSGTLTATPASALVIGDVGVHNFEVVVTDGTNSVTFFVSIDVPANATPTVALAVGSAFAGTQAAGFTLSVAPGTALASASLVLTDADNDTIAVTAVAAAPSAVAGVTAPASSGASAGPRTITWSGTVAGSNAPGTYTYTVTIAGGTGNTATVQFTVAITVENVAPVAAAGSAISGGSGTSPLPWLTSASLGATPTLELATVTDGNTGQTLSLDSALRTGGPTDRFTIALAAGAVTATANQAISLADAGTHSYEITVTDGTATVTFFVEIEVLSNVAVNVALATGSSLSGSQGAGFSITVAPGAVLADVALSVTDGDNDAITIVSVTSNPALGLDGVTAPAAAPAAVGPRTLTWSGTANASNAPGSTVYTVVVGDGINSNVSVTVTITIEDVAPVATAGADATSGNGSQASPFVADHAAGGTSGLAMANVSDANTGQTLSISNITEDAGNPSSAFSVTLVAGVVTATPSAALVPADAGTHAFEVEISDGTNTISVFLSIDVSATPPAELLVEATFQTTTVTLDNGGSTSAGSIAINRGIRAVTITITNSGSGDDLILGQPSISGANASQFSLVTTNYVTTLAAGATTTFTIRFDPDTVGTAAATLSFDHNATSTGNSPFTFTVTGEGLDAEADAASSGGGGGGCSVNTGNSGVPMILLALAALLGMAALARRRTA